MHILGWVAFSVITILIATAAVICTMLPGIPLTARGIELLPRWWGGIAYKFVGATVPPELCDGVPGPGPYVIMSNHESLLDVLLYIWRFPISFRFVAKRELAWIPVFGFAVWRLGHIYVSRGGNRAHAIRSIARAGERVRRGTSVLVYPEGTRNRDADGPMLPFKKGGFHLAVAAQVPILPVAVDGCAELLPKGSWRFASGTVCYRVGTPIETAGMADGDIEQLMTATRDAIEALRRRAQQDREAWHHGK